MTICVCIKGFTSKARLAILSATWWQASLSCKMFGFASILHWLWLLKVVSIVQKSDQSFCCLISPSHRLDRTWGRRGSCHLQHGPQLVRSVRSFLVLFQSFFSNFWSMSFQILLWLPKHLKISSLAARTISGRLDIGTHTSVAKSLFFLVRKEFS